MTTLIHPIVRRVDKGNRRYYTVEGDPLVPEGAQLASVTTILNVINKPALIPWATKTALEKVRATLVDHLGSGPLLTVDLAAIDQWIEEARQRPDAVRDEAADLGTRAHAIIELILLGEAWEPDAEDPRVQQAVQNFLEWYAQSGIRITLSEKMVYSAQHLYAGTMDAQGVRLSDGAPVVLDWKTSNGLYPETALQIAAYAKAHEEMTGVAAAAAVAVRFGKAKADFEARWVADIDESFAAFLAAKRLADGTKAAAWAK